MISGAVLIIVGPAKAFGELMSLMNVPAMIGETLSDVTEDAFVLLMIISLSPIITGMFLESIAQIILLTPLMLPRTGQIEQTRRDKRAEVPNSRA